MRLATASRLDLWFRVAIERNSLYGWPKQRSPRRTNDQTHPNAYFSIREMDPGAVLVLIGSGLPEPSRFLSQKNRKRMASSNERHADSGLSGQWTPGADLAVKGAQVAAADVPASLPRRANAKSAI